MASISKILLIAMLPILLQACAMQHREVNSLAEGLDRTTPEATLLSLQAITPPERDRGQHLLNVGLLKSITGDFEGAILDLQRAKEIINNLQALSVSENLGAVAINETLRSYDASPGERVLLHVLLSIDYLMLNDLDAARVEVLQADVLMKELAEADMPVGQLASAHFIAGLVYELGGELDNARISYRKALNLMKLRGNSPPPALKDSLRNINLRLGIDQVDGRYREQFFLAARPPDPDTTEIVVIYWDGVVTSKRENFISVWAPELNQIVSLALPYYPPSNYVEKPLRMSIAGQNYRTHTIEDIETLLREDLEHESGAIYAMALARAVSKYQIVKNMQNQDSGLALFTNIFAMLTESADTRSWNMLPSSMQIARIALPAGEYMLPFPLAGEAQPAELPDSKLTVGAGEKIVLFVPGVSKRVYSYTQAAP